MSGWDDELHTEGLVATEVLDFTLSFSSSSNNLKERHCLYFQSPLIMMRLTFIILQYL
jgi:hypothetical protein